MIDVQQQTFSTQQVAKILGLGRDYTRALIRSGKLPNVGNPKRVRVPKSAVQRYLDEAK